MKKQRLGKGLSALIPQDETESTSGKGSNHLVELDVAIVKPNPYQPRLRFNPHSFEELKNSLREKGLIQPITVRRVDSHYELIAGERRLRAAMEVGINKIPAYIIEVDSKEEMLELALIENVQRDRLNPIEQAYAFQRLISECNLTQDEVAQKIGKDRSTITNILRLLRLPSPIQKSLEEGEITVGHARALVSVEDPEMQSELWLKIIKHDISVRKLERIVKDLTEIKSKKSIQTAKKSIYIQKVEEDLRNKFGTKVSIRSKKEGGSVEIEFYSPEDLNRLLEIFDKLGS
jgi:ParB family chromosome partitioning protein